MEQEVVQSRYKKDAGQEQILDIFLKWAIIPKLVLCLAAPGTGKTTTIVRLLLELIMLGRKSAIQNFMVLTFTKRTRNDILKKFQDEGRSDLIERLRRIVRNFHSLAFTSLFWDDIITDTNITNKVKELAEATGMKVQGQDRYKVRIIVKKLKEAIASNKVQETIDVQMANNPTFGNIMQECIDWLEQSFEKNKSISYDYALVKFIKRLDQGRNPFKIDLSRIQLLIVDQFQDSNPAQMKIVECILARNPKMRLLLMGDIDQTIYTWRGTDLVQLGQFIEGYNAQNEYKRVLLEYTHRLGSQVVKYSQNLIRSRETYLKFRQKYYGDYRPIPLNIQNDHAPIVIQFESQYSQVNWVIKKIRQLNTTFGIHYKDMTVLLRSFKFTHFFNKFKFQNQRLAAINKQQKIPFTVKSDQKYQNLQTILAWFVYFYKKKYFVRESTEAEIKTILKHMKATPTTIKKMAKINRIDEECLYKKGRGWNAEKRVMWEEFFVDFSNIEKIMDQKESFRQIFEAVYSHLSPKKRCPQLSQYERNEFLEYVAIVQAHIKKQKLKKGPIFAIIKELIKSLIYEVKASTNHVKKVKQQVKLQQKQQKKKKQKNSNKQKKEQLQKKYAIRTLNDFYSNLPQPKKQQKPVFKKVKLQEEQVIMDQTQQLISQQNQSERQQRMQNMELHFTGQADSVQFQTVYKAKGLQFKVVFICSLNYDYKHEDYDPNPQPRKGYRNDQQRQIEKARDLNRQIVKQEEQLRVVYTALTRTSKYSFITASNRHCMMPDYCVKHPHFETLKKQSEDSQYVVPFESQDDIQFKEAYEKHFTGQKPNKNKKAKQEEVSQQK